MIYHTSTHVVESVCACGVRYSALVRYIHTSSYVTQRCEKAEVTGSEQVTDAPPRHQYRTGMSPGHPHVPFATLACSKNTVTINNYETTLKALEKFGDEYMYAALW